MWVKPVVLQGRYVRLEPLTAAHAPLWAKHHEPELFAYMSRGAPQAGDVAGYEEYIEYLNDEPGRMNWAIRVGEDFAGRISYVGITEAHRKLEIGTFIVRPYQGTFVNPESKYLMLRHAIEDLGAIRVQFTVDVRNERSQRAMEKLGAVREGVLRKAAITPDGHIRDSVVYSITDDDWPRVKAGLEARLGYELESR
ncbi:GNAT family N-acetyltransferase [Calidithermus roseus]|uniref:Putative ribosomal N-acetyltransferase YdaF n=1 Tax=Calidithermus roseus TaxID=1644118 RepID=A0A399F0K9_9DEIN|nr:GNAT family protein [Calidithermus roseus]RIH88322.1 putative ribosomal N-acetyltransferase YdaF [Calidithermus roseus]